MAIGGDGQVTLGDTAIKHGATKIRALGKGKVLVGFAGATADAFALMERFEGMLEKFEGDVLRASIELAKQWRTDKLLRHLECLMGVVDERKSLILSGSGDVIEPDDGIIGIGSGGPLALAAARALLHHTDLSSPQIVETALSIVAGICIYTNETIEVRTIENRQ